VTTRSKDNQEDIDTSVTEGSNMTDFTARDQSYKPF
jgi:hypothetical protein